MRKRDVEAGSKRYSLSLTINNVNEFKEHCQAFGLAPATLSYMTDDMIVEVNKMFRRSKETGKLTVGDLFRILAENIDEEIKEMETERSENAKSSPKATKVESRKRRNNL